MDQSCAAKKLATIAVLAAGVIIGGLSAAPMAAAISGTNTTATPGVPGDMKISVSPDEKLDADGTQGSFAPAVQGVQDSDGDQDAFSNGSWEATPQDKVHQK